MNKKWYRLDNAALIFPAIMNSKWSNGFRISFSMKEDIDPAILEKAINDMKNRFPTFFVKLRSGLFWYYLEENNKPIKVMQDFAYPLTFMSRTILRKSCIRVLYYKNRVAVEIFHSVTDGNGGLLFAKNLAAHYIYLKYNKQVNYDNDVFDLSSNPIDEELEDGFSKYSGKYPKSRKEPSSYHIDGTIEFPRFHHLVLGVVDTNKLLDLAHSYNASITSFISGVMCEAIIKYQRSILPEHKLKPVKITIPVNLRKLYGIKTLRNFILITNCGIDPKDGEYELKDIINQFTYHLKSEVCANKFRNIIAANVSPAKNLLMRITLLPIKNLVLNLVYKSVGETKGCMTLSNLGNCEVPNSMKDYVDRFEFILSPPLYFNHNCGIVSYNNKTYINITRRIEESEVERLFFSRLVELGLEVSIESNTRR